MDLIWVLIQTNYKYFQILAFVIKSQIGYLSIDWTGNIKELLVF